MEEALIVTADDFGVSEGVNLAVARAHEHGVLTAASLTTTGEAWEHAVALARRLPDLEIGLHLVLSDARPMAPPEAIPSLVDARGNLLSRGRLAARAMRGTLRLHDVARELAEQLDRLHPAGTNARFINSDQHVHVLPVVRDAVLDAAALHQLAVRVPQESIVLGPRDRDPIGLLRSLPRFPLKIALRALSRALRRAARRRGLFVNDTFLSPFGIFPVPVFTAEALTRLMSSVGPGLTELMVHPGLDDPALVRFWPRGHHAVRDRESELAALLDPSFAGAIRDRRIGLTTFSEARRRGGHS